MMNLNQTKLVGLTMELDLKAREYKELCNKLEKLKQNNIDPNDIKLIELKQLFQKNHDEIAQINKQINALKVAQTQNLEKYDTSNMFKANNKKIDKSEETVSIIENKQNIFKKLIEKIKQIFTKNNRY